MFLLLKLGSAFRSCWYSASRFDSFMIKWTAVNIVFIELIWLQSFLCKNVFICCSRFHYCCDWLSTYVAHFRGCITCKLLEAASNLSAWTIDTFCFEGASFKQVKYCVEALLLRLILACWYVYQFCMLPSYWKLKTLSIFLPSWSQTSKQRSKIKHTA